jgi:biopolymer transport protein ExbD
MINVVFLLLIFFLMTTTIAPRAPFKVDPPKTDLETVTETAPMMFLSANGELFFEGSIGDEAVRVLAGLQLQDSPVTLRADAEASAKEVARLLPKLRELGIREINVVGQNQ